ncbi:hypothetical protein BDV12DRAFT_209034 [Aspergillus spectabilis]
MDIVPRGNDALNINPSFGVEEALSLHGSDWLWAVTAIYIVFFIGLLSLSFVAPESNRVFHYIFTFTLLTGSVTYFAEASNLGWSAVDQINHQSNGLTRQIFFAKYINWTVSFPAISLALGLLSGISWTTICTNIFSAWLWILTYLVAAYTKTNYKWGFFVFGTVAWIILAMSTLNESREAAERLGIKRDYILLSVWANLLWMLYPVAWGLSDGGNVIGVTGGSIFFGVLDVLLVPVLGFAFVVLARKWDFRKLNVDFSDARGGWAAEASRKDKIPGEGAVLDD